MAAKVLHLCGVLLITAALSIPRYTATTLALGVGGTGIAGLVLSTWVVLQARRQQRPHPEDGPEETPHAAD